jgi:hypothetical protein
MTISQYSTLDNPSAGDLLIAFDTSSSDTRKISLSDLAAYILSTESSTSNITQYAAPSATAFNIQISDTSDNTWLVLTPTGTFAAGTITLPAIANVADKQEVKVVCTQIVSALTVAGNGASVVGAPTDLAANGYFTLKYDTLYQTWYRVA